MLLLAHAMDGKIVTAGWLSFMILFMDGIYDTHPFLASKVTAF